MQEIINALRELARDETSFSFLTASAKYINFTKEDLCSFLNKYEELLDNKERHERFANNMSNLFLNSDRW